MCIRDSYITKSGTRVQVAEDIMDWTQRYVIPFVLKPKAERRKRDWWQSLPEYLEWARGEGIPPVIVLGWEAMRPHKAELVALGAHAVIYDEIQHGGRSSNRWDATTIPTDPTVRARIMAKVKETGGFTFKGSNGPVAMMPLDNMVNAAATISRSVHRRLGQTATAIDRIRDMWSVMDLLLPHCEGPWRAWTDFFTGAKEGQYGERDTSGATNLPILRGRIERVRDIVTQAELKKYLPAMSRRMERLESKEWGPPDAELTQQLRAVGEGKLAPSQRRFLRLAQTAFRKSPAIAQRIIDLAKESDCKNVRQMVFFTVKEHGKRFVQILRRLAEKGNLPIDVYYSDGSHSTSRRDRIKLEHTTNNGAPVLVCTPAWATGVDGLQCTDHQHHATLPDTPYEIEQREGRVQRNRQDRPVTIWYWYAVDTIDDRLVNINLAKREQQEALGTTGALDGMDRTIAGHDDEDAVMDRILGGIHALEETMRECGVSIQYEED
jgi:hypothetical protein